MKKNNVMLVTFIAPAVFTFFIAFLYPIIRTFYMSFFALENITDPMSTWSFVGLDNFTKLFTQAPLFVQSMKNIGRIWLIGGAGVFFLALMFSAILTSGIKLKSFFRAVIYLPNVVSAVAMGTMWVQYVYNPRFGLVSSVLNFLGFTELAQTQLTSPAYVFYALMIAYCFGMVGYFLLIFVAAIDGIPQDYFEAAMIEGAGFVRSFFSITLPLIAENVRTCIVLWTVSIVNFFAWSQVFSPLQPETGTVSPVVYMYQLVFGSNIMSTVERNVGMGAAVGVTLSLAVILVFGITSFIFRKTSVEY